MPEVKHAYHFSSSIADSDESILSSMETFGDRIKIALNRRKMSASELARRVGVSRSAINQLINGGSKGAKPENLIKIAKTLDVNPEWLATGNGKMKPEIPSHLTRVPVISYVQAGSWTEAVDSFPAGNGLETVTTDLDLGDYSFALRIKGDSMEPEFHEGDIIIIDPSVEPRPGDYVVAKRDKDNEATFKKYRRPAEDVIELVPLNPDHPPLKIDAKTPGKIIGVMVEHRRYRK